MISSNSGKDIHRREVNGDGIYTQDQYGTGKGFAGGEHVAASLQQYASRERTHHRSTAPKDEGIHQQPARPVTGSA